MRIHSAMYTLRDHGFVWFEYCYLEWPISHRPLRTSGRPFDWSFPVFAIHCTFWLGNCLGSMGVLEIQTHRNLCFSSLEYEPQRCVALTNRSRTGKGCCHALYLSKDHTGGLFPLSKSVRRRMQPPLPAADAISIDHLPR